MTNKLNLYILTEFLKILGLTLLSIVVISLLINIVDSAGDFIEKKVPLGETALYYMLKVPEIFCLVLPIATLLSVLITLGIFNSNSEITAIKACGIGIMEALTPLFAFGILISIVSFVITESAVPPAQRAIVDIEKRWFSKLHHDHFGKSGYWFKTDSIFLNVKNFNMDKNIAEGVNIFEFDSSFKLSKKIDAKVAGFSKERWVLKNAAITTYGPKGEVLYEELKLYETDKLPGAEEIGRGQRGLTRLGLSELMEYIKTLKENGYDTSRYLAELYSRFTFPLVNFIMILVAIPFALRNIRHGGIATGVAMSIGIGFSFWLVFGASVALGKSGALPPLASAILPDALFISIGLIMTGYIRQ